ncbi:MAG: radical SAM protein [Acidobacteria bacterium]|nr:radical SAM protein [Acidobacteriota bacterium]
MRKVPLGESLRIIARGSVNWFVKRPVVVSFEVTDSCTCFCKHCDHGGARDDSRNMKPSEYKKYMQELRPCVVQISGGEPLMRADLLEVVHNIKSDNGLPYTILVSNWSLMTEEKYLQLHEAGVDEFCVSLDFPDQRHDEFRGLPGLYRHLCEVVPKVAALGYDDIVLNNCITASNVSEINAVADKAAEWGVNLNYSAYSPRRTGCRDYFLSTPDQLKILRGQLDRIKSRIDKSHWITNNRSTLDATIQYFTQGGTPNCKAGLRWLVVTSDGYLQPCSMQFKKYGLHEQARMVKEFTEKNTCDQCYVSIRSYLDKTFPQLLRENVSEFFSFKPRQG